MGEKSKIEWTPAPVKIMVDIGGGEIAYRDMEGALVCASLALVPDDPENPEYWSVTHVPSGRRVHWELERGYAETIANELLTCGMDWSLPEITPATPGWDRVVDVLQRLARAVLVVYY
jgi:hypothetical protein